MLDIVSNIMEITDSNLNQRIAERVRSLRASRNLSLEALAEAAGVSRSMISVIERGESNPTAVVLEKLATGLGVTLSALFESRERRPEPVARIADQPQWRDPASGYLRRNVSPQGVSSIRLVEVRFPAGARVAFDSVARSPRVEQQVWVLEGAIDVTVGREQYRLKTGDCLALTLDLPTAYHNPTRKSARYAVVQTDSRG